MSKWLPLPRYLHMPPGSSTMTPTGSVVVVLSFIVAVLTLFSRMFLSSKWDPRGKVGYLVILSDSLW